MSGCKGFQPIDLMGSRVVMLAQCLVLAQCSKTSSLTPLTKQNSLGRLNPQGRAEQSSYQNVGAGVFPSGVVSRRNLRQGSKTSRDSLRSGSVQPSQVAVVVVAGRGRHEAATAVVDSWAKLFQKQLVVTNTNDTQGFSHKLSQRAINVFRDAATTDEQMKRFIHPKHPWMRFRGPYSTQISTIAFFSITTIVLQVTPPVSQDLVTGRTRTRLSGIWRNLGFSWVLSVWWSGTPLTRSTGMWWSTLTHTSTPIACLSC
eukprot:m.102644 g.102644  ORF g.102644 m.102644 type:complete len:258 (-) comp12547_c0_seq2:2107-2880(-)